MTGEQIEKYIRKDLESEPRHNCEALAEAINYVAGKVEFDSFRLMQLLLEDKPIAELNTHSYGFHTHSGRELIEGMQNAYYEEIQFYVD
jgi:hypothetical protein